MFANRLCHISLGEKFAKGLLWFYQSSTLAISNEQHLDDRPIPLNVPHWDLLYRIRVNNTPNTVDCRTTFQYHTPSVIGFPNP